jgi:hypothetical protein
MMSATPNRLARFFSGFQDVPSVGLHAATSALLALLFVLVLLVGLVVGRPINDGVAITVGGFILGYLTKTSVDFAKKRTTDADTLVAQKLAGAAPVQPVNAQPLADAAALRVADGAVPTALPADLATALGRGGSSATPIRMEAND